MAVKIKNLTSSPIMLRLNSGRSLHLSPRMISEDILNIELDNNLRFKKLQTSRLIASLNVDFNKNTGHHTKKVKSDSAKGKK